MNGRLEIVCIFEHATLLYPVKIKSGKTINSSYFSNIEQWFQISKTKYEYELLKEKLEEGNLPFKVGLVEYYLVSDGFLKRLLIKTVFLLMSFSNSGG